MEIPASERDKVFPFIPKSIIPVILITVAILGILITDIATGESTNVFIFYGLPFLYLIVLLGREDVPIILNLLGLSMPTWRSRIVGILSVPLGLLGGWALVNFSRANASILPISTYPFALSSYAEAGLGFLSTMGSSAGIFFFGFVAFFETGIVMYLYKNLSNWLHEKFENLRISLVILISMFLANIILTTHHFISYRGFENPYLYFAALMFFTLFMILGIFMGFLAKGRFGELSAMRVIPVSSVIIIMIHFGFDWFLSRLMIIPSEIILPLISFLI